MEGLDLLRLSRPGIPNLAELNRTLKARTGWPRPGRRLLPSPQRTPLYRRQLHRRADQLDYLEEPDVFHGLFGHVPLLADPRMADFMVTLRSEEHTSELQSLMRISYAVFCLKKQNNTKQYSKLNIH